MAEAGISLLGLSNLSDDAARADAIRQPLVTVVYIGKIDIEASLWCSLFAVRCCAHHRCVHHYYASYVLGVALHRLVLPSIVVVHAAIFAALETGGISSKEAMLEFMVGGGGNKGSSFPIAGLTIVNVL